LKGERESSRFGQGGEDGRGGSIAGGADVELPEEVGLLESRRFADKVAFEIWGSSLTKEAINGGQKGKRRSHALQEAD